MGEMDLSSGLFAKLSPWLLVNISDAIAPGRALKEVEGGKDAKSFQTWNLAKDTKLVPLGLLHPQSKQLKFLFT